MKNRFILIATLVLVLLGGNYLSVWGQSWGADFSIPNESDGTSVPGGNDYKKNWGDTWWWIPRYGNDTRHAVSCSFDENFGVNNKNVKNIPNKTYLEYNLSDFEKLGELNVYYSGFEFEWNSNERPAFFKKNHEDGKINSVSLSWNLEWKEQSSIFWSRNPTEYELNPKIQVAHSDHGGYYDWVSSYSSEGIRINVSDLWKKIKENADIINKFHQNGYIVINLRVVFFSNLSYILEKEHTSNLGTYFKTYNTISIRINKCSTGELGLSEEEKKKNPIIIRDNKITDNYAIYEKQESTIDLNSSFEKALESKVYDVINEEEDNKIEIEKLSITGIAKDKISIANFRKDGKLVVGSDFSVYREIVSDTKKTSCKSNTITFKVFPVPYLEGFEGNETEKVICPTKQTLEVGTEISYYEKEFFRTLSGNRLDFKGYEEYESTYGVEYGWRYWTDRNSTHNQIKIKNGNDKVTSVNEIFDYNNDENGPDLIFPISALKPGVTYYFEQYVTLTNFENAKVEATVPEGSGLKKFYTVRLSKSLDADKLNVVALILNVDQLAQQIVPLQRHAGTETDHLPFVLAGVAHGVDAAD